MGRRRKRSAIKEQARKELDKARSKTADAVVAGIISEILMEEAQEERNKLRERALALQQRVKELEMHAPPSIVHKPRVYRDGNLWCALYGVSPEEGVAGFGTSPAEALQSFDEAWKKERKS